VTLLEQLESHEGRRHHVYFDSLGVPTIGVGRNIRDKGLSDDEIDYLLMNDVRECVADLQGYEWWSRLDPVQRDVLTEMRFQLGPDGLRAFKGTLAAVALGDYVLAAERMLKSKVAREQAPKRWRTLARQMSTGVRE
jgi:lysozyme